MKLGQRLCETGCKGRAGSSAWRRPFRTSWSPNCAWPTPGQSARPPPCCGTSCLVATPASPYSRSTRQPPAGRYPRTCACCSTSSSTTVEKSFRVSGWRHCYCGRSIRQTPNPRPPAIITATTIAAINPAGNPPACSATIGGKAAVVDPVSGVLGNAATAGSGVFVGVGAAGVDVAGRSVGAGVGGIVVGGTAVGGTDVVGTGVGGVWVGDTADGTIGLGSGVAVACTTTSVVAVALAMPPRDDDGPRSHRPVGKPLAAPPPRIGSNWQRSVDDDPASAPTVRSKHSAPGDSEHGGILTQRDDGSLRLYSSVRRLLTTAMVI